MNRSVFKATIYNTSYLKTLKWQSLSTICIKFPDKIFPDQQWIFLNSFIKFKI